MTCAGVFCRLPVTFSSNFQRFLIRHPNFLSRGLLRLFYSVEVLVYSFVGAKSFLTYRQKLLGPNFCALGKLIIGDHEVVASLINQVQKRGHFLGRGRIVASRFPKFFLLSLSDTEATENKDESHQKLHDYFWNVLIPPAMERASQPEFQGYIDELIGKLKSSGLNPSANQAKELTMPMVVKYMMRALFDVVVTEAQLKDYITLFFSASPRTDYIVSALKPTYLASCCSSFVANTSNELITTIENSPALADYEPSEATNFVSKRDLAESLMGIVGIAAFNGTVNQCINVLTLIPNDYAIDLNNKKEIFNAVMEATRLRPPVNNVNIITLEDRSFDVGTPCTLKFPAGTVVAASVGLASLDPNVFPDPEKFNHTRENLLSANINFNMVGFNATENGRRTCPGRNLAMKLTCDLLASHRQALSQALK